MELLENPTASTQSTWAFDVPKRENVQFRAVSGSSIQSGKRAEDTREAVRNYIWALRSLGKTRVNTRDIAIALDLPRTLVEQAVAHLKSEGVKRAR